MTQWTVTHKAPLSLEFSRQEYWSRLPFPSPGDLPDQETVKKSACDVGGFDPLKKGMVAPIFLPEEFHGQRSLAGYSPWRRKESDND